MHSPDVHALLQIEVPFIVVLGERRMSLEMVSKLVPGMIIELDKAAEDALEVHISNKSVGAGTAVKVGENFGVQITSICTAEERVQALGPQEPEHDPAEDLVGDSDAAAMAAAMLMGQ